MIWEYLHEVTDPEQVGDRIVALGAAGWELVAVIPVPYWKDVDRRQNFDRLQFFMKRPVPSSGVDASGRLS